MEITIKIIQFVLAFALLVLVHETGHYLFARLFKMRVDKFYLFFNPWCSLLRAKRINGKWQFNWFSSAPPKEWENYPDKTEWGVGWLPMGGYCKISGMIDESMDKEQMKQPPQQWEYRSHPAWHRMFVMIGGVMFNVILAIIIYWGMLFTFGEKYLENKDVIYGIQCDSLALEMGFRHGDKVLRLDGREIKKFNDIHISLIRSQIKEVVVLRNNDTVKFDISEDFLQTMLNSRRQLFEVRIPFVIAEIPNMSHNALSGLQRGDSVVAVDSMPLFILQDINNELQLYKNQTITLTVSRNDTLLTLPVNINGNGEIGVIFDGMFEHFFTIVKQDYGLLAALPAGIAMGYHGIVNYLKDLKLMFTPNTGAYKSLGSFITIANIFPGHWDWTAFWHLSAMLSIMLAVLNILPIPALDGGHLIFVLYEMITRRKPSDKVIEVAQWIGFVFLITIMLLAFGNDLIRHVF